MVFVAKKTLRSSPPNPARRSPDPRRPETLLVSQVKTRRNVRSSSTFTFFSLDFFFYLSVGGNNDDGLCVGWLGVKSPFLRALLQSSFSSLIGLFLRIACGNKGFLLLLLCSKVTCLDLFRGAAAAATEGVQLGEQQWCT